MNRGFRIALIVVGGLFALLVLGGAGFQWVNEQPRFCNSCHEMNFYYTSWMNSTHGLKVVCTDCHSEPGVRGYIEEKVRGAEQIEAHFSGNYPVPIKIIQRVKNDQCLACHPNAPILPNKTIQAEHALHFVKNVLCADCHSRLVHAQPGQPKVIQTYQCDSCHKAHPANLLTGIHANLSCSQCHTSGKYKGQDPRCEACHPAPARHIVGITSGCSQCHAPTGWKPAKFDHSAFPLTGSHQGLDCVKCHPNNRFQGTLAACESCHTIPSNHLSGITTNCAECHTPEGWVPAHFDHSRFPLNGGHQGVSCEKCHPNGQFQETSPACESCHQVPANHLAGITSGCAQCHTPAGWVPAQFDHTKFKLTGVHQQLACNSCHSSGVFQGASTACAGCHNPPATHLGMPGDCTQCHTTAGFTPSTFNHQQVGEHVPNGEVPLQCSACHASRYVEYSCMGGGCHSSNNPGGD